MSFSDTYKQLRSLLDDQNRRLYTAARARDLLLYEKRPTSTGRGLTINRHAWLGSQIVSLEEQATRLATIARSMRKDAESARLQLERVRNDLRANQDERTVLKAILDDYDRKVSCTSRREAESRQDGSETPKP